SEPFLSMRVGLAAWMECIVRLTKYVVLAPIVGAMLMSSCGTTTADRAVSGGLLGAAGGAAIGSVTGSAGKGAVIGGVLGAGAGAVTAPPQHCVEYNRDGSCYRYD